jgi:four helix bundle protein
MPIKNFEELEIWKDARALTKAVYQLTSDSRFSKDFGLRDQIRRASVSIMSNIAEGFERGGNQEFIQFLYVAKGSCGEVRSQLYAAMDQNYLDQKVVGDLLTSLKRLSIMIKHLIDHLKGSGMRGPKYSNSTSSRSSEMS